MAGEMAPMVHQKSLIQSSWGWLIVGIMGFPAVRNGVDSVRNYYLSPRFEFTRFCPFPKGKEYCRDLILPTRPSESCRSDCVIWAYRRLGQNGVSKLYIKCSLGLISDVAFIGSLERSPISSSFTITFEICITIHTIQSKQLIKHHGDILQAGSVRTHCRIWTSI